MHDIIIIGGGIAGLYCAYKIKKLSPSKNILLLESDDHLGGRANNVNFNGQSIPIGAGVGRKKKDKLLLQLLKDLKLPFHEFTASSQYASTIHPSCNLKEMFMFLKREYRHGMDKNKTFKQYAKTKLEAKYGNGSYNNFTTCSGYTDYENECAYDTLYHYGFDDNYSDWTALGISWKKLIETLAQHLGSRNIHKSCYVKQIKKADGHYEVISDKQIFSCKKVVIATTIESVLKFMPDNPIYRQIHGQPFLRVYGKFSKLSTEIMKAKCEKTTVVPGPIHKIIPINPDKGIYMIAYTDNNGAKTLEKHKENTKINRELLCELLEIALDIPKKMLLLEDMVDFYWDDGTHYYTPIKGEFKNRKEFCKHAQRPEDNIRVVGELISMKQGWVEGALESVEDVIDEQWITI
jgi:Flavin containing amine oxidoreductase